MDGARGTRCPQCGGWSPTRLAERQVCAACRSANAWTQQAGEKLIIGRGDIERAERRRRGEAAGHSRLRKAIAWTPVVVSLGLGAAAIASLVRLLRPIEVGPLAEIVGALESASVWAVSAGAAAFAAGLICLIRLRRQRQFRMLSFLIPHCLALIAGVAAAVPGALAAYVIFGSEGWQHDHMPRRSPDLLQSEAVRRIAEATAVIVAPDDDGDARMPALGVGAVIAREPGRAWLVTNSHVALPSASVASFRETAGAPQVWVEFSDGRGRRGAVRWVARPPIDVAIVEVPIDDPPPAIPIAVDSRAASAGTAVTFVPNPYRAGWRVEHGEVTRRRAHQTPAGDYNILYTDLPVLPGDSGSGLFNEYGELIGLNTWTRLEPRPQGISLPSEAMRAIVRAIEAGDLGSLYGGHR
jgi:S1-C subfamily serine protease